MADRHGGYGAPLYSSTGRYCSSRLLPPFVRIIAQIILPADLLRQLSGSG